MVRLMKDDCLFCKIVRKEIPSKILYEDDDILIMLDAYPNTDGHTLVIPKKHYEDIYETPEDELKNIDGDPNELSLFSCIVLANIYWKPNSKMMCIKNMHFGVNNGNTEQVEKVKPFVSYFS